jgi:hypothetical protein
MAFPAGGRRPGAGRALPFSLLQAARGLWLLRLLFLLALVVQSGLPAWADHGSLRKAETVESFFELCGKDGPQSQDPNGSHKNSGHSHNLCVLCYLSYGAAVPVSGQPDCAGIEFPAVVSRLNFAPDSFSSPLRRHAANRCRAPPLFL